MTTNNPPSPTFPSETKINEPQRPAHTGMSPAAAAWEEALKTYRHWIGPADTKAICTARERFLAYCRSLEQKPEFANAAPLVAFGFLTHAAFNDARRKTRIFHR